MAKKYAVVTYIRSSLKDSERELRSRRRPGESGRLKIILEGRALTLKHPRVALYWTLAEELSRPVHAAGVAG